jgi:TetR/AcrR family transcriptional regulator, cholesterol catabolism regulator
MTGDERLESILEIAERMFFERGYRGVSMRHLAAEVGVQISTLYYYFPSKEEILYRVVKTYLEELLNAAQRSLEGAGPGATSTERVHALVRESVLSLTEHRQAAGITLSGAVAELPTEQQAELNSLVQRYEALYLSTIREGIQAGEFVATDAALAAYLILGAQSRLCAWFRPDGRLTPNEIADTFGFLLVRSLAVEQLPEEAGAAGLSSERSIG